MFAVTICNRDVRVRWWNRAKGGRGTGSTRNISVRGIPGAKISASLRWQKSDKSPKIVMLLFWWGGGIAFNGGYKCSHASSYTKCGIAIRHSAIGLLLNARQIVPKNRGRVKRGKYGIPTKLLLFYAEFLCKLRVA